MSTCSKHISNGSNALEYVELVRLDNNLRKHLHIENYTGSLQCFDSENRCNIRKFGYDSATVNSNDSTVTGFQQKVTDFLDSYSNQFPVSSTLSKESSGLSNKTNSCQASKTGQSQCVTSKQSRKTNRHREKNYNTSNVTSSQEHDPDETQLCPRIPTRSSSQSAHLEKDTIKGDRFTHTSSQAYRKESVTPKKGITIKSVKSSSSSGDDHCEQERCSPTAGEDASHLKVVQECTLRDRMNGSKFQAQQPGDDIHNSYTFKGGCR